MPRKKIPVIDLFAGPGGLGEGFSSIVNDDGSRRFDLKVSIEKEEIAHRTLTLRALFRSFPKGQVPDCYYDYLRGFITREELFNHPDVSDGSRFAAQEPKCAELGVTPHHEIDGWIKTALNGSKEWVLIGGPPCQAYSLAGRSRMRPSDSEKFEKDKRHFLYTEYLRIIKEFGPAIFVMENVKGILSSKHGGSPIFDRILSDLREPGNGFKYQIRSFVVDHENPSPTEYLIKSEKFGLPQARHRVILFGIRSDLAESASSVLREPGRFLLKEAGRTIGVRDALAGLPPLRSRLSREPDSWEAWLSVIKNASKSLKAWRVPLREKIEEEMSAAWSRAQDVRSFGGRFIKQSMHQNSNMPKKLQDWLVDPVLDGVIQHETRTHMRSDLDRYMFASCFALIQGYSPKLPMFPPRLLPDHGNMEATQIPFIDRFRVQVADQPATTVVSHISKDGHYYIHYDPAQCRSMTVREAARIQTFPDNYLFEGNRTQQYWQVGNAVPPLLARQIAEVVIDLLDALEH